jgi:Holliday junction resolvase RusA-like endonuclease
MKTWTIPLPGYTTPPLSQNRRQHWAAERKIKQQLQGVVIQWAQAVKLPKGRQKVTITLHWEPSVERRRDVDNYFDTVKPCVDALVRYGLCADDDHRIVLPQVKIHPVAALPKLHYVGSLRQRQPARLWLTVEDLSVGPLLGDQPTEPPDAAA